VPRSVTALCGALFYSRALVLLFFGMSLQNVASLAEWTVRITVTMWGAESFHRAVMKELMAERTPRPPSTIVVCFCQ
jgi:hypothetical protein